jgi:signal transduction histidine kinase
MLRNLRFRSKLVLVLAVPLVALLVFAAIGINGRLDVLDSTQRYEKLVETDAALDQVSRALEDESIASRWYAAAQGTEGSGELLAAREDTDRAIAELRESVPDVEGAGVSDLTFGLLQTVANQLGDVETFRPEVDSLAATPADIDEFYFRHDDRVLGAFASLVRDLDDPDVSGGLFNVLDLWRARQASARQNGIVISALAAGSVGSESQAEFEVQAKAERTSMTTFLTDAPIDQIRAFGDAVRDYEPGRDDAESSHGRVLLRGLPEVGTPPAEWYDATAVRADAFTDGSAAAQDIVTDDAQAREDAARSAALRYTVGALLAVLVALVAAWAVVRATTRPLQRLTKAAQDMSQRQLPQLVESLRRSGEPTVDGLQPVKVSSRDEIGDLGRAFNSIQSVTVEVAQEQSALLRRGISDLYVNLARRNQSLLDRQIELIDQLEGDEKDPEALDALFRLDHLATRMRRNAESLLVLADSGPLQVWREPLRLLDVVRGAAAEIPDFDRVQIDVDQQLLVKPNVAADLTHLMAELLENATTFSPPDSFVSVGSSWVDGTFFVTVTDRGLGMPDDQLAEANALLRDPPVAGLTLSRALGLFVVGHLAVRHGIVVELQPGHDRGLTAVVALPADVLLSPAETTPVVAPPAAEPRPEAEPAAAELVDTPPVVAQPMEPELVGPIERAATSFASATSGSTGAPLPARRNGNGGPPTAPTWSADVDAASTIDGDGAVQPTPTGPPLAARVPGGHLLHLPMRRDGMVETGGEEPVPAEPGLSRPEQVRKLLSEHRRGIERADTAVDRALPSIPEDET